MVTDRLGDLEAEMRAFMCQAEELGSLRPDPAPCPPETVLSLPTTSLQESLPHPGDEDPRSHQPDSTPLCRRGACVRHSEPVTTKPPAHGAAQSLTGSEGISVPTGVCGVQFLEPTCGWASSLFFSTFLCCPRTSLSSILRGRPPPPSPGHPRAVQTLGPRRAWRPCFPRGNVFPDTPSPAAGGRFPKAGLFPWACCPAWWFPEALRTPGGEGRAPMGSATGQAGGDG